MLSNDRKQILLMNPVRVSLSINKFKKASDNYKNDSLLYSYDGQVMGVNQNVWDGIPFEIKRVFDEPWKRGIAELWLKTRMFFNKKPELMPELFFSNVKDSFKELNPVIADEKEFVEKLKTLDITKQKFIKSKLLLDHAITEHEIVLKNNGFTKYQTEESLINFIIKSKKGLCLTEMQYFNYEIPSDVIEKIQVAEELCVFDNYYIFNYDPNAKCNIFFEPVKDPIVFGVIIGSNKLYYVADWISEYCNLTYDTLIKESKIEFNL